MKRNITLHHVTYFVFPFTVILSQDQLYQVQGNEQVKTYLVA